MRAEQQRQFRRVVSAHPGTGRDVGEVARVAVAVGLTTGFLPEADGFCCGAEEGAEEGVVGYGLVGAVWVVWSEGDAVFFVCADDCGLLTLVCFRGV